MNSYIHDWNTADVYYAGILQMRFDRYFKKIRWIDWNTSNFLRHSNLIFKKLSIKSAPNVSKVNLLRNMVVLKGNRTIHTFILPDAFK